MLKWLGFRGRKLLLWGFFPLKCTSFVFFFFCSWRQQAGIKHEVHFHDIFTSKILWSVILSSWQWAQSFPWCSVNKLPSLEARLALEEKRKFLYVCSSQKTELVFVGIFLICGNWIYLTVIFTQHFVHSFFHSVSTCWAPAMSLREWKHRKKMQKSLSL